MIQIQAYLRRWHILISLLHRKFGGKGSAFSATLIMILTIWVNLLSITLLVSVSLDLELLSVFIKGDEKVLVKVFIVVILWGTVFALSWIIGGANEYKVEAHSFLRQLEKNKNTLLNLIMSWLIFSYIILFPLSLYLYGVHE